MSQVGAGIGDAGGKHSVVWQGKELFAKSLSLGVLEEFSKWLYKRQKDVLREDREELGDERYQAKLDVLREQYLNDEFDMSRPLAQAAMKTISGGTKLISLVLDLSAGDAFAFMTECPAEAKDLLATLDAAGFAKKKAKQVEPATKEGAGDPKAAVLAEAPLG